MMRPDFFNELRWRLDRWRDEHSVWAKAGVVVLMLILAGSLGLATAVAVTNGSADASQVIRTTSNGEVQTGDVMMTTVNGRVQRVIRWHTRSGETVIQRVAGPTKFRTVKGDEIILAGATVTQPGHTSTLPGTTTPGSTVTVQGPSSTVTLPGDTQTVTVTENNTVTETVTQNNTVTETVTLPAETVTVTEPLAP
jgi:hypothetical protein